MSVSDTPLPLVKEPGRYQRVRARSPLPKRLGGDFGAAQSTRDGALLQPQLLPLRPPHSEILRTWTAVDTRTRVSGGLKPPRSFHSIAPDGPATCTPRATAEHQIDGELRLPLSLHA